MSTITNLDLALEHLDAEVRLMTQTTPGSVACAMQYALIQGAIRAYLNLGVLSHQHAKALTERVPSLSRVLISSDLGLDGGPVRTRDWRAPGDTR